MTTDSITVYLDFPSLDPSLSDYFCWCSGRSGLNCDVLGNTTGFVFTKLLRVAPTKLIKRKYIRFVAP